MAQRPSFDMNKLTTAEKILGVAGLVFFIDTFLPWQTFDPGFGLGSITCSAWECNGGALGVLAALLSLVLVVWIVLQVAGVTMNITVDRRMVTVGLAAGTVLFGLLKFLIALTGDLGLGWAAWVGLILLLALAYGAYMKWQEPREALPPTTGTMPPAPGPPPPVG